MAFQEPPLAAWFPYRRFDLAISSGFIIALVNKEQSEHARNATMARNLRVGNDVAIQISSG